LRRRDHTGCGTDGTTHQRTGQRALAAADRGPDGGAATRADQRTARGALAWAVGIGAGGDRQHQSEGCCAPQCDT
jgi:hypothetical protein